MDATRQKRPTYVIAAGIAAALALLGAWLLCVTTTPIPAYSQLQTAAGTYQGLERRDGDNFRLYVQDTDGYTDWFTIDSVLGMLPSSFKDAGKPGDPVTLRCMDDHDRSVLELTVNGNTILTYEEARAGYRADTLLSIGLTLTLVAVIAGTALFLAWKHREKEKRTEEIRLTLEQLEAERTERRKVKPALYHAEERMVLEEYISEAFGPIAQVFYEPEGEGVQINIAVIAPTEEEDYCKLVTMGMGARKMNVPPELVERNCAFAELCMYLPPDWTLLSGNPNDTWPFHWLKSIARMPLSQRDWLGAGHCVHTGPLETDSELTELLLAWASVREGSTPRLMLPGSKLINFYQVLPLYEGEVRYRNERGFSRLWQRLVSRGVTAVVDMSRECCYDPETDFSLELTPFIWTQGSQEWTLGLYTGDFLQEHFEIAGLEGNGYEWETLAKAYLEKRFPQLTPYIHFDSEEGMFFAYTAAEDALRIFALAFRDLCGDEDAFGELLTRISGNEA